MIDKHLMSIYDDKDQKRLNRKQLDRERKAKRELDAAVRSLLQHPHGRRYLFWLLDIGKAVGANPFTGHALSTSFSCGEQNVGQQIMAHILEVSPDGFLLMLKEREDEKREVASGHSLGDSGVDGWADDGSGGNEV